MIAEGFDVGLLLFSLLLKQPLLTEERLDLFVGLLFRRVEFLDAEIVNAMLRLHRL